MNKSGMTLALVMCVLCAICVSVHAYAADAPIEKVLPVPACTEGWSMEEKAAVYNKDNLFDRIDGEAEIYFPYGFEVLGSARYVNKQDPRIAVEADVYKMGSLIDAFGMYANYRRAEDSEAKIGAEGIISASQLLFYQDRYFVRLQATGTISIEQKVFLACAGAISNNLPSGTGRPKELAALMVPDVVRKTERYVAQSLLGYAFFHRGLMADAMTGSEQVQVFMVLGDSGAAAQTAFNQYQMYLQESGTKVQVTAAPGLMSLEAADPLYGNVFVQQYSCYIVGAVRLKDTSAARTLVEQLRKRLPDCKRS
jgi:hypothetical protein